MSGPRAPLPRASAVAVVDIGSNSGRVVAYRLDAAGRLRIQASSRAALRLVNDVDDRQRLGDKSVARLLEALRDFRALAEGSGAARTVAVATAAMRDAANGEALVRRIRDEVGVDLRVIDGPQEAQHGFEGAVRGLPAERGLMFDMGGGSMQLTRFAGRAAQRSWSLPLGSLRLSHQFLHDDPPTAPQVRALRKHVREALEHARVPALRAGDTLVGTGGTVRNLAKVDRRQRSYPIERLHGYTLSHRGLVHITGELTHENRRRRDRLPGLSRDRGDSVVGGALGIETLLDVVNGTEILVSGQGVREGLAYGAFGVPVPSSGAVRRASIASLVGRYAEWDGTAARRRAGLADALLGELEPAPPAELREALHDAALVLDVGRAIDFFDRHEHTADILRAADLDGFTHREIALRAAVVLAAGDGDEPVDGWKPLLGRMDQAPVRKAGVLLALADEVEARSPGEAPVPLDVKSGPAGVRLALPALSGWRGRGLRERFAQAFGRPLEVRTGG